MSHGGGQMLPADFFVLPERGERIISEEQERSGLITAAGSDLI